MTYMSDRSDPIARWRATIDALEAVVLAEPEPRETDPAEAEEVHRLVMVRTARRRRNSLPAAWQRRPGIVPQIVSDAAAAAERAPPDEPAPRPPHPPARPWPAWHE